MFHEKIIQLKKIMNKPLRGLFVKIVSGIFFFLNSYKKDFIQRFKISPSNPKALMDCGEPALIKNLKNIPCGSSKHNHGDHQPPNLLNSP